jgi:hypothetical protein
VLYVAFPHRGEDVPYAGWLGRLLRKGVETAPTLDNTADETVETEGSEALTLDLTRPDQAQPGEHRRGA